jgi:hypothetical protein
MLPERWEKLIPFILTWFYALRFVRTKPENRLRLIDSRCLDRAEPAYVVVCSVVGARQTVAHFGYLVDHEVKIADFERWLEKSGGFPREVIGRRGIRAILGMAVPRQSDSLSPTA